MTTYIVSAESMMTIVIEPTVAGGWFGYRDS